MFTIPENSTYQTQSIDTSPEADQMMFQLLRQLSPTNKALRTKNFNRALRKLAIAGIKTTYPHANPTQIKQEYIKRRYGNLHDQQLDYGEEQLMINDPIALAVQIAVVLESLNIPYLVGGSVASSLLGESRATQDLDLVADLQASQINSLIQALSGEFYISESAVQEAIDHQTSFNIIHLPSIEKADIFILGKDPFSQSKMSRRQLHSSGEKTPGIYIYSAEDIILQKLRWYQLTNGSSQTQWRDVLGVIKIQQQRLDLSYLQQWAVYLKIPELLKQALEASGL